jgi:hypothetical protein
MRLKDQISLALALGFIWITDLLKAPTLSVITYLMSMAPLTITNM